MSILNTLKAIENEGFDPRKDGVQKSTRLEAGKYPVVLGSAQADSNFGRDQIAVKLQVVSGASKGMTETIFLSFDETLPPFVLEKNGRTLLKLAAMANVTFTEADQRDEYSIASALERGVGRQFEMTLTITENKKKPEYPYRNYDFNQLIGMPDPRNVDAATIDDSDYPF